jgi:hypothetical protein
VSKGFIAALAGIGMTLLAWYGPWEWPAWPAFTAIDLVFGGHTAFADRPYAARAAIVVVLIVLNVGVWAVVAYALLWSGGRLGRRRRAGARGATREA